MAIKFELKEIQTPGGQQVLKAELGGFVDSKSTPDLKKILDEMIATGAKFLLLDCGYLDGVNSTGLAVLAGASDRAEAAGSLLVLARPNRAVRMVVECVGFTTLLNLKDTEAEALAFFAERAKKP
ncbi:MAG: STAS domain-containing protein [Planctomycetes bacterium]|nr:STAS domain-containing protein [Planctomycetota bacterium]